ncbi:hypothetical protein [Vibrio phage vB_VcM_SY]
MAIRKDVDYPGRWEAATSEYPMGKPKNRTTSTSKDGSYLEKKWIQDYEAFFGAILNAAGYNPNGAVDTADSSQFFDALQSMLLGVNQTWHDLSGSRTEGVVYTNDTGKPIQIAVSTTVTSGCSVVIDGSNTITNIGSASGEYSVTVSAIIPNNSTYEIIKYPGRADAFSVWLELR